MNIKIDGHVYNPLGGASYMFEKEIIPYILMNYTKNVIKISVGAQINSSPHFGTLETIALSYALAKRIEEYDENKKVIILYEIIETAPGETIIINNVKYQKNLVSSGVLDNYIDEYKEILNYYTKITGIKYEIRYQSEFNNSVEIKDIVRKIIKEKDYISKRLDPKCNNLRLRCSCPICGLTDKNCVNNRYLNDEIYFVCPVHGEYKINIERECYKLEYNSPYRNLIRGMMYTEINNNDSYDYQILRITGSDYAGFYQEEMRYKLASYLGVDISRMSMIFYAPLVCDWSGAKMSKSLYVKKDAYKDIPREFINYSFLREKYGEYGLEILFDIVLNWVDNPFMLFRTYSIYYFIEEFKKYETSNIC